MLFLKTLYKSWMKFAHALGWVNTRIILTVIYLLIFTPVALIFKVIGKDPMERKIEKINSYWIKKEPTIFRQEDYRRQF
ncbi:MAG: SxtJ family membrane protein [Deltaproteobacteria bacterium]